MPVAISFDSEVGDMPEAASTPEVAPVAQEPAPEVVAAQPAPEAAPAEPAVEKTTETAPEVAAETQQEPTPEATAQEPAKPAEAAPEAEKINPEEIASLRSTQDQYRQMLAEDKELRVAFLKSLQKRNMLPSEYVSELNELSKPAAPAPVQAEPEAPKMTKDQARAEAKKLFAQGREDEAIVLLQEATVGAEVKAIKNELASARQRQEQERIQEAERVKQNELRNRFQSESLALAEKFPTLVEKAANGRGIIFKDKKFEGAMQELVSKGALLDFPLERIARIALADLGMLGVAKAAPAAPKPKPVVAPAASPVPQKAKVSRGEMTIDFGSSESESMSW